MIVAAEFADGEVVYLTKQQPDTVRFVDSIRRIRNGKDAYWCRKQGAAIVKDGAGK